MSIFVMHVQMAEDPDFEHATLHRTLAGAQRAAMAFLETEGYGTDGTWETASTGMYWKFAAAAASEDDWPGFLFSVSQYEDYEIGE